MSSSKPSPKGKKLPTTTGNTWENLQSWVNFVKKGLFYIYYNILSSSILFLDKIIFHLIMLLTIIRPKIEFHLFQPKKEKNLWL